MILVSKETQSLFYYIVIFILKFIMTLIFIIILILSFLSCSEADQDLTKDEQAIYTMIIDSVFNDTYKIIHINDSTHSLIRYMVKNVFSETLFGEEPKEWFRSLFKNKNCNFDEDLIMRFIDKNRKKYYIAKDFKPVRDHKFVNYLSIYYYLRRGNQPKNRLTSEIRDEVKFGIISLSRTAFNDAHTVALIEVNIHRERKKEIFFSSFKKVNASWKFASNCYMYGPFKVKEENND